jgi:sigma-E factor negative regulatory protein RseB
VRFAVPGIRRPLLLLSALITITVPGLLAVYAAIGHDAGSRSAAAADRTLRRAPVAGGTPVTMASGLAVPAAAGPAHVSHGLGMQLLSEAATAGLATSYQGVELISRWSVVGTSTVVSNVWHRAGGKTVTQTSDAATVAGSQPYLSFDADNRDPEGVFGVTKTLVGLLGAHYNVAYAGQGSAVGRTALIIEVRRVNGSVAARFWLDKQTRLPLRREVYDANAQVISEDAFIQVQFGQLAKEPQPAPAPAGTSMRVLTPQQAKAASTAAAAVSAAASGSPSWSEAPAPAQLLQELHGQGSLLPAALPGGLSLYEAAQSQTAAGRVVDLGYSDGLSVVSVFVQRGTLPAKIAGWQPVKLGGHEVFASQHSLIWSGHGFVYTVLADAPPETVVAAVAVLPQNSPPGFWMRLGRGLGRLASMVDPFH